MKDEFKLQDKQYNYTESLQQQQIAAQQNMNAMQMHNESQVAQAALVEQTNPSKVLDEIKMTYMGLEQMPDGSTRQMSSPIMNDKGINRILFILRAVVNQGTILSHLEMPMINKIMNKISDDIVDDITLNWKDYGIEDKTLFDYIVDAAIIPSYMALMRAYRQNEKHWLNRTVVENISTMPKPPAQKKESFMDRFK